MKKLKLKILKVIQHTCHRIGDWAWIHGWDNCGPEMGRSGRCPDGLRSQIFLGPHRTLVCDLGGGSLELIRVENRIVRGTVSLPLGAVRLTERFVSNARGPSVQSERDEIADHVHQALCSSGFPFPPSPLFMIVTGGAFVTVRAIFAEAKNISFAVSISSSRLDRNTDSSTPTFQQSGSHL